MVIHDASAPLQRFAQSLGHKPYCTDNPSEGLLIRSKPTALKKSHIQLNQRLRKYLAFDIDREGGAFAYDAINLQPTIVTVNPENAHAHLLYELQAPVCFTEKGRQAPKGFYTAIQHGMALAMGADMNYIGLITKNPLSPRWKKFYCNARYTLDDLAEYCTPVSPYAAPEKDISETTGRNCQMFDSVRRWAYQAIRGYHMEEAWYDAVLQRCEIQNADFSTCLPHSEIRATAKSISRWTWRNRHKFGKSQKNRGAAEVDSGLSIRERQQAGADYTNSLRRQKTEASITKACQQLQDQQQPVTQKNLITVAGVSRRTLSNYRHLWAG